MADSFEQFCGGPFWNETLLVDNSWPQFTACFLTTALVWTPAGLLLLTLPLYVLSIRRAEPAFPTTLTFLGGLRTGCCLLLSVTSLTRFIHTYTDQRTWTGSSQLAEAIWTVTYLTMAAMIQVERVHGVQGRAVPFFFWILSLLSSIVRLNSLIQLQVHEDDTLDFTTTVVILALQLLSLALTFVVDSATHGHKAKGKRQCPESTCSYPAYLFFYWMTGMIVTSFRRGLKESDLWQIPHEEQSDAVVPVFDKAWARELRRTGKRTSQWKKDATRSSEYTSLLGSQSSLSTGDQTPEASLIRVLVKIFWFELLTCFVLKTVSDLIFFLSPVLLNSLLTSLRDDDNSREWHSYVICLGLFLSTSTKAVFFSHSLFRATRIGIRIKTALNAAIYNKILNMNSTTRNKVTGGEILNMMCVDTQQIMEKIDVIFFGITTPLQVVVAIILLYQIIGWSVLVGMGVLLLQVPINGLLARRQRRLREENLQHKDARVKLYSEVLNAIKVLKLYAWEPSFREKIRDIRWKELSVQFRLVHIKSAMGLIWDMAPYVVMLATFATFILADRDHQLTAAEAFVSLAFFNILRSPLNGFAAVIVLTTQAWVSVKRINRFLVEEELDPDTVTHHDQADGVITIKNGSFTWHKDAAPCLTRVNVAIRQGQCVAVVGPVGSGKSSLINAVLGEMEREAGTVNTTGRIAYVPQQAWIQNATVRDNILFGQTFSRSRYRAVLKQCQLERDLDILPAGDETEIGEKGINLSGGQKQRVSLARAVYSDSDVYLLDDPLSAVDSHVGKAIFNEVIGAKGVLKHKTRVLVTHGVHWLPMVDEVIVMHDGKVSERGSYEELVSHDGPFAQFLKTYLTTGSDDSEPDEEIIAIHKEMLGRLEQSMELSEDLSSSYDSVNSGRHKRHRAGLEQSQESVSRSLLASVKQDEDDDSTGRLTTAETVETGKVSRHVFLDYLRSAGILPLGLTFVAYCLFQGLSVTANFLLDMWANDDDLNNATNRGSDAYNDRNDAYLAVYGAFGVGQVLCLLFFNWVFWTRMVHAARAIHRVLASRLLRYPMAFFDTTPMGRILNRVSRDVETVDNFLPLVVRDFVIHASHVLVTLIVIVVQTPIAAVILVPAMVLYYLCQRLYIPTSRQLKRLESVTRTPIYTTLSETMSGTASIRAYGAAQRFRQRCKQLVDHNQVYFFASHGALRWIQWNLDLLASVIIFAAAVFEVVIPSGPAGGVGLTVSYALQLSGTLIWMTKDASDFETFIVSVERLKEYSELKTEAEWIIPDKRPPSSWPQSGQVEFQDFQTRYRPGLDLVLRGVTVTIKAGSKVGIVGRTGAGKSSLTLSLFRLIEAAEGRILIDGVNIADIGLHDLRSHLTILPQEPVLFSGSLRTNLDPFNEYTDNQLWVAIERAHLRGAVEQMDGGLSADCGDEGSSLSVGQRQLVCLARTLLRRTKILVLDEATAAVDMETDALIQNTIRTSFSTCTVIAIAHRLNTILDYDRIVVMENGQVVEYAPPQDLLADSTSIFHSMARDAGVTI